MFAQIFHQKVNKKEITKKNLNTETIKRFEDVFRFVDNAFTTCKWKDAAIMKQTIGRLVPMP